MRPPSGTDGGRSERPAGYIHGLAAVLRACAVPAAVRARAKPFLLANLIDREDASLKADLVSLPARRVVAPEEARHIQVQRVRRPVGVAEDRPRELRFNLAEPRRQC